MACYQRYHPIYCLLVLLLIVSVGLFVVNCDQQVPTVKYKLSTLVGYDAFGEGISASKAAFSNPAGLFVDEKSNIVYIADAGRDRIRMISNNLISTIAGGQLGWSDENLLAPESVAVHPLTGEVYFADTLNNCIKKKSSDGTISLVAGTVSRGYSGDGGAASGAQFYYPKGISITKDGSIYIADSGNHVIRKIFNNGTITTFSGTGNRGFSGDGALANNATLFEPSNVFVDQLSNEVYIADSGNNRIRKVLSNNIIVTVVGGGTVTSSSPDGVLSTLVQLSNPKSVVFNSNKGELIVSDTLNNRILKVFSSNNSVTTLLGNSTVSEPQALFLQGNDFYFIDRGNLRVMKYDSTTGKLSFIAGSGSQSGFNNGDGPITSDLTNVKFNRPVGLFADWNSGELLVADSFNHVIRKIEFKKGQLSTVVGKFNGGGRGSFGGDGEMGLNAQLNVPVSVLKNQQGDILISDSGNNRVRKVSGVDGIISTIVGSGQSGFNGDGSVATSTLLNGVSQLLSNPADDDGDLLIADSFNNKIRKVSTKMNQVVSTVAGSNSVGDNGPALTCTLKRPRNGCFLPNGDMIIADVGNARIRKVESSSGVISTLAGKGTVGFSGDNGNAQNAEFGFQFNLACSSTKNEIFVSDNNRIRRIDLNSGNITTIIGSSAFGTVDGTLESGAKLAYQNRLFITNASEILIAENYSYRLRKFLSNNNTLITIGGSGSYGYNGDNMDFTTDLKGPLSIISTKKGEIFFTEYSRIRKLLLNASIETLAGANYEGLGGDGGPASLALLSTPTSLALSLDETQLYFADMGNSRIRKIDLTTNKISTIAGKGKLYSVVGISSGDGGNAVDCQFIAPESIFLSQNGLELFVVDSAANNIRKIDMKTGIITTVVGKSWKGDLGSPQFASLDQPTFMLFNNNSHHDRLLYISHNSSVRIVNTQTNSIQTLIGRNDMGFPEFAEHSTISTIGKPQGIVEFPNGDVAVVDSDNHVIRKLSVSDGIVRVIAGNGFSGYSDHEDSLQGSFNSPSSLIIDPSTGQLLISDTLNHVIRVLTPYCESFNNQSFILDRKTLSSCILKPNCANCGIASSPSVSPSKSQHIVNSAISLYRTGTITTMIQVVLLVRIAIYLFFFDTDF